MLAVVVIIVGEFAIVIVGWLTPPVTVKTVIEDRFGGFGTIVRTKLLLEISTVEIFGWSRISATSKPRVVAVSVINVTGDKQDETQGGAY